MKAWMQSLITRRRQVITETFTSSQTWTCPYGVSSLLTLVGKGVDGSANSSVSRSVSMVGVQYSSSGTGTSAKTNDWSNMQGAATGILASINGGGTVNYTQLTLISYPSTETLNGASITLTNVIASTATANYTAGWNTSGAIASNGDANATYSELVPAAPGANVTGYGYTFTGGAANTPATPVTYTNVPVTPATGYALVVPTGGSITITYYK